MNEDIPKFEDIRCPLCNSDSFKILYYTKDRRLGLEGSFRVVKCNSCNLIYINPRIKEEFISNYYPDEYYKTKKSNPEEILNTPHEKEKLILMDRFKLLDKKDFYLLDIGCNKGEFLENLRQRSWRHLEGIELDEESVEFAKRNYNLDIFKGKIEDFPKTDTFDIITFWHTLEHIYDIDTTLKKVYGLLKPGGFLVISSPNIDGLQAKLMGEYWYHLDGPRHLIHFNKDTLGELLGRFNFKIDKFCFRYPAHNFDGWYNSIMFKRQDFKDKRGAKRPDKRQADKQAPEIAGYKRVGLNLVKAGCGILSGLEMALGSGGAITICAKK